jgi:long-chain acyl-CoA synthetase
VTASNLSALVREAATATPDKPALHFHGETVTWGELESRVSAAARGLQALGARPGDRVAVHLGNTPDFVVAYFGALRAGCVALPVNTGYTADELAHVLTDSGASIVVTGVSTASLVQAETVVVTASAQWRALLSDRTPLDPVGGGEDLAVLLYTSGTSGRPKGAMLTHRALLANLDQTSRISPPVVAQDDVVLLVLPLFHVFGLNGALGAVARHGATGVLTERFDPVETLELVRRHGVTNIVGAPPMYVAWSLLPDVEDAFTSVRLALSATATSPVGHQPSASGPSAPSGQYPLNRLAPRTAISPGSPSSTSAPRSSTRRSSTPGTGRPIEPGLATSLMSVVVRTGAVSVSP